MIRLFIGNVRNTWNASKGTISPMNDTRPKNIGNSTVLCSKLCSLKRVKGAV